MIGIRPFWHSGREYLPRWYGNIGSVTYELVYDEAATPLQNGARLYERIKRLSAGDHIVIGPGDWQLDYGSMNKVYWELGTEDRPICVRAVEPVTIRTTQSGNILDVWQARFAVVEGLGFEGGTKSLRLYDVQEFCLVGCRMHPAGSGAVGVNTPYDLHHLYFIDNEIWDTGGNGEGFYIGVHDGSCPVHHCYIAGNYLHDMTRVPAEGIELKYRCHDCVVRWNWIQNTREFGITAHSNGMGPDHRNYIGENVLLNTGQVSYGMFCSGDAQVQNNLVIGGLKGAVQGFVTAEEPGEQMGNLSLIHNTLISAGRGFATSQWPMATAPITVANNAIYSGSNQHFYGGEGGVVVAGNVLLTGDQLNQFSSVTTDGGSWDATPLEGSLLIGSGDPAYLVLMDLVGGQRNRPDPGAIAGPEVGQLIELAIRGILRGRLVEEAPGSYVFQVQ